MKPETAVVIQVGGVLTARESQQRTAAEHEMGEGLDRFWKGAAVIAAGNLWRSTHKSLALYLQDQIQCSRSRSYQMANYLQLVVSLSDGDESEMSTIVDKLPESSARELADLPPKQAAEVIKRVNDTGKKPTASAVREARQEVAPKGQAVSEFFDAKKPKITGWTAFNVDELGDEPKSPRKESFADRAWEKPFGEIVRWAASRSKVCGGPVQHAKVEHHLTLVQSTIKEWQQEFPA